jgi:hypothetical protein
MTPEEVTELEDATDEVAREGSAPATEGAQDATHLTARRTLEAREAFEDATDEVSREDGESS